MITASQVVDLLIKSVSAGMKSRATKKLYAYVEQQKELGHQPVRTLAAIKAIITRKTGESKPLPGEKP